MLWNWFKQVWNFLNLYTADDLEFVWEDKGYMKKKKALTRTPSINLFISLLKRCHDQKSMNNFEQF